MHLSALQSGDAFAYFYGKQGDVVLDIGGKNVNGSLRQSFESRNMKFISIDIEHDTSVDIVVEPGQKLPFSDNSVDLVVSTSCFEHDPCFWLTFKEMARVVKLGGYIYVNAPTGGPYHTYPGDNWRFYSDAGQALAYWSGIQLADEQINAVSVVETFHIAPTEFNDFVCVWQKTNIIDKNIVTPVNIVYTIGKLESALNNINITTVKKC